MSQKLLSDGGWSGLLARLPDGLDLGASARGAGAFVRARGVPSAAALLRLALVYANTPLSLRATVAWAAAAGVAVLSDVALLYRLQLLEGWLGVILAALLGEVVRVPGELARPVQIVDATIAIDGSAVDPTAQAAAGRRTSRGGWPGPRKGVAWRIHARLELAPVRFSGFVLTDGTGAERLDRFTPTPGAIVLADRCYARHGGMAAVWGQGADLVVRYGLSSSALHDPDGVRVTLNGVLRRPDLADQLDLPVRLPGPDGSWHPGRLLLVRRPAGSAARSRARIDQKARKRGGTATLKQRRAADWLVLLTTLDAAAWPAQRVMALYRLRWQIELAFKRLKSQARLAELQAKEPRLARACILAKLILALLADRLVGERQRPFRPGPAHVRRPPCGA